MGMIVGPKNTVTAFFVQNANSAQHAGPRSQKYKLFLSVFVFMFCNKSYQIYPHLARLL